MGFGVDKRVLDLEKDQSTRDELLKERNQLEEQIENLKEKLKEVDQDLDHDTLMCAHIFDPVWLRCHKCNITYVEFYMSVAGDYERRMLKGKVYGNKKK